LDERDRRIRDASRDRLSLPHDPRGRRGAAGLRQLGEPYSADAVPHGLTERVRHGLWRFADQSPDARLVAGELTRPYPAYISFASALATHGAIDQIPREISLASLSRPKRVRTARGNFVVHRLAPEVFGGFEVKGDVAVATPEKAIFDFVYVTQASGDNRQRLPELDLPASFSRRSIDGWVKRISSRRLRRPVADRIARTLEHAEFEDALSAKRRL